MEILKILQLGKFYPVRGGVEKVMYDLMTGLSGRGVDCDMLCALSQGRLAYHSHQRPRLSHWLPHLDEGGRHDDLARHDFLPEEKVRGV